jgi:MFS family permease
VSEGTGAEEPRARGRESSHWRTRDVWLIAGSAGFADLGYQAIVAGVPLLLVVRLHAEPIVYGVAAGLGYGLGTFASLLGGRLADRVGRKRVAVAGNLGILLLAAIGLATSVPAVVVLFVLGWLARNFRSPVRRAMLTEVVDPQWRRDAFGFLHALDVGGGMVSALAALALIGSGAIGIRGLFLLTAVPIALSSVLLALVSPHHSSPKAEQPGPTTPSSDRAERQAALRRRSVLAATLLYGFSAYSLGFPVLSLASHSGGLDNGFGGYALFLGVSAVAGYLIGRRRWSPFGSLALGGYGLSALSSLALALSAGPLRSLALGLVAVGGLGVALGFIETIEPTVISAAAAESRQGRAMGSLSAARSAGLLIGNLALGAIYATSHAGAFGYGALLAALAAVVIAVGARQASLA